MESIFLTNVHELAYASFFAQQCSTLELRILHKFYKASMVVFKAGNVSYNAVMMANTVITDFFVKHHNLFARGLAIEFLDFIVSTLFCYDGFWDILNRINVHLFYLTYRHQILSILSDRIAIMYGSQPFEQLSSRLDHKKFANRLDYFGGWSTNTHTKHALVHFRQQLSGLMDLMLTDADSL
jgi:hypothetical protein